jgi:hypothetical protein
MAGSPEEAPDDLGLGAVVVHGRHEPRQPFREVVHLPVQALDVGARLLEKLRRRRLHKCTWPAAGVRQTSSRDTEQSMAGFNLLHRWTEWGCTVRLYDARKLRDRYDLHLGEEVDRRPK